MSPLTARTAPLIEGHRVVTSSEDIDCWNAAARAYTLIVGQPTDSFYRRAEPILESTVDGAAGKRILDVGCANGWLGRRYAAQGAWVVGVDGSQELINMARVSAPDQTWLLHDLSTGLPAGLGTFDVAIAHMVLMDLPDMLPLLSDLYSALLPNGRFIATILHPAFFHQDVFDAGDGVRYRKVTAYRTPQRWKINTFGGHWHYHRPLEIYVRSLAEAGFVITGLVEPPSLPNSLTPEPEWTAYEQWFADIPTMLAIQARVA